MLGFIKTHLQQKQLADKIKKANANAFRFEQFKLLFENGVALIGVDIEKKDSPLSKIVITGFSSFQDHRISAMTVSSFICAVELSGLSNSMNLHELKEYIKAKLKASSVEFEQHDDKQLVKVSYWGATRKR